MPARKKKHAKKRPRTALARAAAAFETARVKRDDARAALAHLSKAGDPHHIVDPSATWMNTALRKARKRLLAIPGVMGVGLGNRTHKGVLTSEPSISVFVDRKVALDEMRRRRLKVVPKYTRIGKRKLRIDVVQLGALDRQVAIGANIGPATNSNLGTLGVIARDMSDNASVAVTAMHVSGISEVAANSGVSIPFCSPSRFVTSTGGIFADLVRGTTTLVDAAKLRLHSPQPVGGFFPGLGPIAGWRPLTFPGDLRTTVFMFGAISGLQQGFITNTAVDLPVDGLRDAIVVNIASAPGDSGAALVDSQRFLLGFLVGAGNAQLGNLRVFCPAGLVFSELACDIP